MKNLYLFHTPEELKQMRITTVTANKVLSSMILSIKSKQKSNNIYTDDELLNEKKRKKKRIIKSLLQTTKLMKALNLTPLECL